MTFADRGRPPTPRRRAHRRWRRATRWARTAPTGEVFTTVFTLVVVGAVVLACVAYFAR